VPEAEQVVDFPTLGFLAADWIEAHCIVPDSFRKGQPFTLYGEQLWFLVNHYRVRPEAHYGQLATAFHYRRSQLVRPQKWGKGPLTAAQICLEGVGPALFAGWAVAGERYDCAEHGCRCGWTYDYQAGEPKGMPWPTPLIQITATSEEQTDNIYDALRPMIDDGPLHDLIPKTGEEFIRLPGGGRIDVVTSSAQSRLGQRVTFVPQDEVGIWTEQNKMVKVAETQRRGLAGMGGRAVETTNAWDPAENSVAQRTSESKAEDVYRDHRLAPKGLSYGNRVERRRIHRHVYGDSLIERGGHVDLDGIEAEAAELMEKDPEQAERFFGNRIVAGSGAWMDPAEWAACGPAEGELPKVVLPGDAITLGFDGAQYDDSTALIGCRVSDGHVFPLGIWEKPEGQEGVGWEVDRDAVAAAVEQTFDRYDVQLMFPDPWGDWRPYVEAWALRWPGRIVEFDTRHITKMCRALERIRSDVRTGALSHDGSEVLATHMGNARRRDRGDLYTITKERKGSPRKIDAAVAATLAYAARVSALESPPPVKKSRRLVTFA
jgi:hypothetical protein